MASRDPKTLHPALQPIYAEFCLMASQDGLDFLTTCTYRSNAEQDELYAQGRTTLGNVVTRARGGQSAHNFTLNGKPASKAFDIVPVVNGKVVWDAMHPAWQKLGKIGMDLGLNWYGAPKSKFREFPHFQLRD